MAKRITVRSNLCVRSLWSLALASWCVRWAPSVVPGMALPAAGASDCYQEAG